MIRLIIRFLRYCHCPLPIYCLSVWIIKHSDQPRAENTHTAYIHRETISSLFIFIRSINFIESFAQQRSKIKWAKRKMMKKRFQNGIDNSIFHESWQFSEWTKSQITPHKMICQIENWFIFVLNWIDKTKSVRFFPFHIQWSSKFHIDLVDVWNTNICDINSNQRIRFWAENEEKK